MNAYLSAWRDEHGAPYTQRYSEQRRKAYLAYRQTHLGKAARAAADLRRRARKAGSSVIETIRPMDVHERDGWTCGICHQPVDPKLTYPHLKSASVDHIVSLADGGEHTMTNVRCTHWICNVRRGIG